jgi:RimJ/RimL family protein N-acetyltransferase
MNNEFIQLENDLVLLRPLQKSDIDNLLDIALQKELWNTAINRINDKDDLIKYFDIALSEKEKGLSYPFVIVEKKTNKYVGSTRYGNISLENKRLEIGWTWLGKEFQRAGINISCKYLLLKYAFEDLQFNRVEFKTDVINIASRNAIENLGASVEGIFRQHIITQEGRIRDTIYYSILYYEWNIIKLELLKKMNKYLR